MYKYVFIKGTLEKVEVGSSTYENLSMKGYKFYSSIEEANSAKVLDRTFGSSGSSINTTFNSNLSDSNRSKFN
jgi:hypothetical protein